MELIHNIKGDYIHCHTCKEQGKEARVNIEVWKCPRCEATTCICEEEDLVEVKEHQIGDI